MLDIVTYERLAAHPVPQSARGIVARLIGPGVGSMERLEAFAFFAARPDIPQSELLAALGEIWPICDNVSLHAHWLRPFLKSAGIEDAQRLMSASERRAWDVLPAVLTVYRGCYGFNEAGLSWSLCEATAAQFVTLTRYSHAGHVPLLVTMRIRKLSTALKLERGEQEIIALRRGKIISRRPLPPTP